VFCFPIVKLSAVADCTGTTKCLSPIMRKIQYIVTQPMVAPPKLDLNGDKITLNDGMMHFVDVSYSSVAYFAGHVVPQCA
jgi:hypothetical protein